ncbi:hypothetical protein BCR39DRAFT_573867 [Naematelia encephala]|uniref:P-loop containing nucleoside triphosphate hydrolase protein n=1 Tax=Naematelia encephala TaxID=71784 RepID=A0A1Y2BJX3_9TREE|nr:hypothetical protein BCR39DRAFT_573867 [Naematelia encephala]
MRNSAPLERDASFSTQNVEPTPLMINLRRWIAAFEVLRSACLAGLVGLSIVATIKSKGQLEWTVMSVEKHGLSNLQKAELGLTIVYFVALLHSLALVFLRHGSTTRRTVSTILNTLLPVLFVVYCYRDVYPYITFTFSPIDTRHLPAAIVWTRFSLLGVAAILVPLFAPRLYSPVDPSYVAPEPNPEQTANPLSFLFFNYVDKIIYRAWRTDAIQYEDLPPLADYDRAEYLKKSALTKLHPIRRQELGLPKAHLIVGIVSVFWKRMIFMAVMISLRAVLELVTPVGVNRLLTYLQDGPGSTNIQPWFWITRALVRIESLFTQLLFEQSLRIKMKDEEEDNTKMIDPVQAGINTPAVLSEDTANTSLAAVNVEDPAAQTGGVVVEESDSSSNSDTKVSSPPSDSGKGKTTKREAEAAPIAPPKKSNLAGRINTLMSSDINNVVQAKDILLTLIYSPLQLVLGVVFLYQILSWPALAGLAVTAITLPIPAYLSRLLTKSQRALMEATDARVQTVTEAINSLKITKLFAWEEKIKERIAEKRELELRAIRRKVFTQVGISTANWLLPIFTMITCYGLYTGVLKQNLTAAQVFSSITMYMFTSQLTAFIQAKVSTERLNTFLTTTELLDEYKTKEGELQINTVKTEDSRIFFHNAVFTWSKAPNSSGTATGQRSFRLKIDDLEIPRNQITLVAGKTSAGKTSFLMALLGEMTWIPSSLDAAFNLPRKDGVAYSAQEAWVMADTVRGNILFGNAYDEARYKKVLHACALEQDLKLFDAGDQTELGEKGLNASGGQKARISLARAVYSPAQILLLDDVLSALDITTCKWIIDKLFRGDLLKGRTVVLVTHHVSMCVPIADYTVHLALDGSIDHHGPIDDKVVELLTDGDVTAENVEEIAETEVDVKAEKEGVEPEPKADAGKLVVAEEKAKGRVSRATLVRYFGAAGGVVYWFLYWIDIFLGEILFAGCNYWLGAWSSAYERSNGHPEQVSILYYLGIYVLLMVIQIGSYDSSTILWTFGSLRASRKLHGSLVHHILHAPMRWIDKTPTGRIIGRFTADVSSLDASFVNLFQGFSELAVTLLLKFFLLLYLVPTFAPLALSVGIIGGFIGQLYMHAQMSTKREQSNAKSPMFGAFAAAINGIVSIRAYGAQEYFHSQLQEKTNRYVRCATAFYNLNRWMTVRIDALGGIFSAGLAALLFYGGQRILPTAVIGFALNQAVSFSDILLYFIRISNDLDLQANSIERINDYIVIDQEPAPTAALKPPASWPTSGEVEIEHLTARYFEGGPVVLNDLSLTIEAGSRVGIVGRTGSGKSTLTMALLRVIPTEGAIRIAGVDTKSVNLDALRSRLTIIPQDPTLLSGSMRFNLDPFDQCDDADLLDAMKSSGLLQSNETASGEEQSALTLDTTIAAGGSNLSQGQRQLVSLARALVRRSKILVLDEATASVDHATDALVQKAIRSLHEVTILTVAHRLSTIMDYDKVMVLSAGELKEFDTPQNLLKNPDGYLRALSCASSPYAKQQIGRRSLRKGWLSLLKRKF